MRRARKPAADGVALFPFLAVLICTMGVLILLLVGALRHSTALADTVPEEVAALHAADAAREAELAAAREDHELRRALLEQSRQATAAKLEETRLLLAHLEDHTRRLEDEYRQLAEHARLLAQSEDSQSSNLAATQAELARLEKAVAAARQDLEAARQQAAGREKYYALIPYDGPNGTRRRPIYIECLADRIVLQPEGLELPLSDFEPPIDPGNSLASALRATREHHVRTAPPGESPGEPYPLLIVRPEGAETYSVARQAMKSWDAEFGYELIDGDLKLKYPPADEALKVTQARAIADARRRRQLLAAAAPSRYGRERGGVVYRATTSGGFERVEVGGSGGRPTGGPAARGAGRAGESAAAARSNTGLPGSGGPGSEARAPRPGQLGNDPRGTHSGDATALPPGTPPPEAMAGEAVGKPGFYQPRNETNPRAPGATRGAAPGQDGGQNNAQGLRGGTGSGGGQPLGGGEASSLAQTRGSNWGLPGGTAATAFRRPIAVQCLADRVILIPEAGDRAVPVTIDFRGDRTQAVDALVAAIGKRIESWGIAGANSYWKPALEVRVAPGAEARFEELQILLDDSGIDLTRAQP